MTHRTEGIHHITAMVNHVQDHVDFYAGILGLRLVKQTVNFDAPEVYHLYFGDEQGSPGTAFTFFPFEGGRKGRIGGGQVGWTTFVVPPGSLAFWEERLSRFQIAVHREDRFQEKYLRFRDRDGLQLEMVEREEGKPSEWLFGGIPSDHAIKGFGGAVLYSVEPEQTKKVLQQLLGLEPIASEHGITRFHAAGSIGQVIDLHDQPMRWGSGGLGTIHHIAWRAKDDRDHQLWRDRVLESGLHVTPIVDRKYFKSLYFREYGGILFEIATDPPGFTRDEPMESLGENLMLPEWLEPHRAEIEKGLLPFQVRVLEEDLK